MDKEAPKGFGAAESEVDINATDETKSQATPSQMNDSIGLSRQKNRDSKEQELTPS